MADLNGDKKILSIDIETYCEADLTKVGVYKYAKDPSFEILLLAYAFDDDPVDVIDMTAQRPALAAAEKIKLDAVIMALQDPEIVKSAYNANFERTCLAAHLGIPMPPEQWFDTMIQAAELGLPRALGDVGVVLGLPEDEQKIREGRNLIRFFSMPCRPTKTNGQRTRNLPEHAPEKWAQFIEYNRRDVETERAIRKKLERFSIAESEWDLWNIDQAINDRGVRFDRTFVRQASAMDKQIKADLLEQMKQISGIENPKSVQQVKTWIKARTGVEVTSLDKRVIGEVMDACSGDPAVVQFLQLRSAMNKTSTTKYDKMLECAGNDDRIRGLSMFYGAGRTGRWAGRLVQMQNLAKNNMPDEDLDDARQLVRAGNEDGLVMIYDDPTQVLSELIRTSFIPRPGCKFIVSDFSAIEARVLAWMAGEKWRLDVFNGDGKIYEASAERMFHLPPGSVKKGDPMRQKGKIAELALGYGGAAGALIAMGALDMGLQENELKPLVDSWRAANRQITKLWWAVDQAARLCIKTKFTQELRSGIRMRMEGMFLRIGLPSGRELSYAKPRIDEEDRITFEGMIQNGGWGRQDTYGPKLVENIVQAVSRDCLAVSMKRLEEMGIPIVFHVHDEVICEVPEASTIFYADGVQYYEDPTWTAAEIADVMGRPIEWAPGLPLRADAYECEYYRKD